MAQEVDDGEPTPYDEPEADAAGDEGDEGEADVAEGEEAAGEESEGEEGTGLDTEEPGGEYQLRGPGDVASPEELLGGTGGDPEREEPEETPEEESTVSLELDLDEDEESGELPPVHEVTPETEERLRWLLIPPYYQGLRGANNEEGVRLVFPLFFQRWTIEGRRELAVLPFYWRSRGPAEGQGTDVAFPLVWSIRNPDRRTLVIGNVYASRSEESNHAGIAPLIFWGNNDELAYQIGFPIFWRFAWEDGRSFMLVGPGFSHVMEDESYRRGIFPLVWWGERQGRGYGLGLPLVYHVWDRNTGQNTTTVPPLAVRQYADGWAFSLSPLFWVRRQEHETSVTVLPLFHYRSNDEGRRTFVSPLAWYHRHAGVRMGGALLYHFTRRPNSRFDGVIPFYLRGENTQLGTRWQYIAPIIYTSTGPVRRRNVVFPVVWDFENRHISRTTVVLPIMAHHRRMDIDEHTTWVLPTFQYTHRPDGFSFNFHPLVYTNRSGDNSHQVVAPLFWRFDRPDSNTTIFFPLYWDFTRGDSRTSVFFPFVFRGSNPDRTWTAVLNVVHTRGQRNGVPYWSFNFFPFFRVGRPAPDDIEWDILLGLTGYGRRGSRRWVDVFWVPVELGGNEATPPATVEPGTAMLGRD